MRKEKLDELEITPFDLTRTEVGENDSLTIAGHPLQDNEQQPLQLSYDTCKNILGIVKIKII